jgi:hypothetical protein
LVERRGVVVERDGVVSAPGEQGVEGLHPGGLEILQRFARLGRDLENDRVLADGWVVPDGWVLADGGGFPGSRVLRQCRILRYCGGFRRLRSARRVRGLLPGPAEEGPTRFAMPGVVRIGLPASGADDHVGRSPEESAPSSRSRPSGSRPNPFSEALTPSSAGSVRPTSRAAASTAVPSLSSTRTVSRA